MRLSEMLTVIREYPALKIKYEAMREQQASQERTAVQLSIAYNNLQIGNRQLSQKNKALETALVKLVPRLNSREHSRRFYKTVAPYLDPGGFVLYRSAAELTRFHISKMCIRDRVYTNRRNNLAASQTRTQSLHIAILSRNLIWFPKA